ncbi:hypothetical protein GALMADRAFT_917809 [Galerina marginata CBS 339.88]|uniref:Uncharacterized protein n=1 Tax=Galerina marginata (strain CBS 339.88) TaxID=685588 RepID=A0A067SS97_GALM3|nr:hypothetical protein GALMADRAFT_917809 [Galerina marginata CBS 339.88]
MLDFRCLMLVARPSTLDIDRVRENDVDPCRVVSRVHSAFAFLLRLSLEEDVGHRRRSRPRQQRDAGGVLRAKSGVFVEMERDGTRGFGVGYSLELSCSVCSMRTWYGWALGLGSGEFNQDSEARGGLCRSIDYDESKRAQAEQEADPGKGRLLLVWHRNRADSNTRTSMVRYLLACFWLLAFITTKPLLRISPYST